MVVNYHIDICKWVDGSLLNKVLDILSDDMKKASNFMQRCPQYVSMAIFNVLHRFLFFFKG